MKNSMIEDEIIEKSNAYKIAFSLILLTVCIILSSVYLSIGLKKNNNIYVPQMIYNVHFENVKEDSNNNVVAKQPAIITEDETKIKFDVVLTYPRDRYGFTFDVVNGGTLDAMVETYSIGGINSRQASAVIYDLTYEDGTPIKEKDVIRAGEKITLHFYMRYARIDYFDEDETINTYINFKFKQADHTANKRD